MESKVTVTLALLSLLTVGRCQPPQPPVYQSFEEEVDRQIVPLLLGLLTPTITNVLTTGLLNLGSAVYNAFTATAEGKTLELIPLESLFATPIKDSSSPAEYSYTTSSERPKRRPYIRALVPNDDKPLLDATPKTSESS